MAAIYKYVTTSGQTRWRVLYYGTDGKRHQKRGFRTKVEASTWAAEVTVTISKNQWVNPASGTATVGEVGDLWLAMQTHLKPSTASLYRQVWAAVKKDWGNTQVAKVNRSEVQAWVAYMGRSPSWVRHCHNVLSQILDFAVTDRMIFTNPAAGVKLPRKVTSVKVYWSFAQLQAFAKECGERQDLILLLGTSGMRWGEAVALRPIDLDVDRGRIHITRNVVKVDGKMVFGTTKTHETRTVAVAEQVMNLLVQRAETIPRDELLWRGQRGGVLKSPGHNSWFSGALARAMAADETLTRISPHGLRHVAAGLLVQAGANVKAVQAQLGHASAAMTLDRYAELFDPGLDEVAGALNNFF